MAQKFQTSLDETRLLMLATQILFGFQLQTVFQDQFGTFTLIMRQVDASALLLMVVALTLLLAPASQHRLDEHGHLTGRIRRAVTSCRTQWWRSPRRRRPSMLSAFWFVYRLLLRRKLSLQAAERKA